jgi:hypothetical protein
LIIDGIKFSSEVKKQIMQDQDNVITNSQQQNPATNQQAQSQTNDDIKEDNTIKDPDDWKTGDEPMTGAQRSYLKTLSDEAGEDFNEDLTKAEASKRIELLQENTSRGLK